MKERRWKPSPDIFYVVETRGVSLVNRKKRQTISIPYPYAGLWGMIACGTYGRESTRRLMALLLAVDEMEAEKRIIRTLEGWLNAGFLEIY